MKKFKILAIICALVMATNVHAALQSRPGVDVKLGTQMANFFKYIREMEAEEGALGLSASFGENDSGIYDEITESNNIDVHMCKNTEWGAVTMLSSSKYGAGNGNVSTSYNSTTKLYNITASTTGNVTGIFGLNEGAANSEYVAAGIFSKMYTFYGRDFMLGMPSRYVDRYTEGTDYQDFSRYIPGDATYEVRNLAWFPVSLVTNSNPVFSRGRNGIYGTGAGSGGGTSAEYHTGSRACIWVGDGI